MSARRGHGEDSIYFDHEGDCKDSRWHRGCPGRWRGVVSLGKGPDGKRVRRKVSGRTKQEVKAKLDDLHAELDVGVRSSADYTVQHCADDWLAHGLDGRAAKTKSDAKDSLKPLLAFMIEGRPLGDKPLRDLTADHVYAALVDMAKTRSTRTLQIARNCLTRAIHRAEVRNRVGRNAAALSELPEGQEGRPSKAMTLEQAKAFMAAAETSSLHAYIVLSVMTGIRPEEARALRWDHVVAWADDEQGWKPVTEVGFDHERFAIYVWRSVRKRGDTKTERSRRTLGLPDPAVEALKEEHYLQEADRYMAEERWQETGLVFANSVGTDLDPYNVRREFRRLVKAARLEGSWSPRELRHTFVSLMSESGVPIEEIARLAGHTTTRTTEVVYRKELRPVIQTGAEVMGRIFAA
jgi:integrase